jgi:hypothetical protein
LVAKVAASTVAPRLLERITELSRRADLAAPDGDANAVAEFLDNVLLGEQLEAFERGCLESESRMAEVADCHTLLAELIREATVSAPLDPTDVERLVGLIGRETPRAGIAPLQDDPLDLGDIMRAAKAAAERPVVSPPKQRPGASLGAWVSAGVAIVLLLVLGGLLVRSIWPRSDRVREVAVNEPPRSVPEDPPVTPPEPAPTERELPVASDQPPGQEQPPAPEPVVEPPVAPVEVREPEPPSNESAPAFPPPEEPPVIPLPVMEADAPEPAADAPEPDAAPASQPQAAVVDAPHLVAGGPLLHRVVTGNDSDWRAVSVGSKLANSEEFVVPVHCYPQIVRGDVALRLLPRSRGAMTVDRDGTLRIEIVFGHAVVWSEAADTRVGITAGGMSGVVILGPRQPVGIDVELTRDSGEDPTVVPPGMRATLVASGGGRFRQTERDGGVPGVPLVGLEVEQPLPPRSGIIWDAAAPGAARVMPMAQDPPWMKLVGPVHVVDRHAAEAMTDALTADVPAEAALRMTAESRRVEDRMAAAATLALLGDFDLLVEMLSDESSGRKLREGEWAAFEAMTVPLALARGANAATALRQAFTRKGPPGRDGELYLLARGLTAAELSAGGAEGLVKALEDQRLVVRRYALKNLVSLLPDASAATRDYRPDRSGLLNDKGLAWWRARLTEGLGSGEANPTNTP